MLHVTDKSSDWFIVFCSAPENDDKKCIAPSRNELLATAYCIQRHSFTNETIYLNTYKYSLCGLVLSVKLLYIIIYEKKIVAFHLAYIRTRIGFRRNDRVRYTARVITYCYGVDKPASICQMFLLPMMMNSKIFISTVAIAVVGGPQQDVFSIRYYVQSRKRYLRLGRARRDERPTRTIISLFLF